MLYPLCPRRLPQQLALVVHAVVALPIPRDGRRYEVVRDAEGLHHSLRLRADFSHGRTHRSGERSAGLMGGRVGEGSHAHQSKRGGHATAELWAGLAPTYLSIPLPHTPASTSGISGDHPVPLLPPPSFPSSPPPPVVAAAPLQ